MLLCDGAEHKGTLDLRRQRRQRGAQHIGQAHRLEHQAAQLGKHRRRRIGLKVLLVALLAHREQTRPGQIGQLALHRASARLRQLDHLVCVEAAVRRTEQDGQHALPYLGEQGVGGGRGGW